jgi:hypothetical protein
MEGHHSKKQNRLYHIIQILGGLFFSFKAPLVNKKIL